MDEDKASTSFAKDSTSAKKTRQMNETKNRGLHTLTRWRSSGRLKTKKELHSTEYEPLSAILEQISKEFSLADDDGSQSHTDGQDSFETAVTVECTEHSESCYDEEYDLDRTFHTSKQYHIPSAEGIVSFMINTNDNACGTLWIRSPNARRPHLELNITPSAPRAQKAKVRLSNDQKLALMRSFPHSS